MTKIKTSRRKSTTQKDQIQQLNNMVLDHMAKYYTHQKNEAISNYFKTIDKTIEPYIKIEDFTKFEYDFVYTLYTLEALSLYEYQHLDKSTIKERHFFYISKGIIGNKEFLPSENKESTEFLFDKMVKDGIIYLMEGLAVKKDVPK